MIEIRGVTGTNKRESFTFTPSTADELIRIYKIDGCIGDTELKRIQIEEGRRTTDFVTPQYVETEIRGLFKDLRDIRVEITDENSDTWSNIRANSEAGLIEYHKGNLMSSLGISPQQHIQAFENKISGDYATFEQRLNGMQTNIRNGADEYTDTQLAKLRQTEIQNLDGRISTATQTLDEHATRLQGVEGSVSSHTQTLQGFQNKLEDAEGNISSNTQLINGFNRQVKDVDGRITQINETIDGVETKIVNRANQYTDTKLADLRRTELKNIEGNVSSMEQSIENFRQTLATASGDVSQVEQTIRGIREEFKSADKELEASFERTLEGAETRIKDSAHSYTNTELSSMRETLIESVDGKVSKVTQSLDRYESRLSDAEGNISSNTQSIKGFERRVENLNGRFTEINETIDGVKTTIKTEANQYTDLQIADLRRTEIKNLTGDISSMEQSIENFRQTLRTASGDVSQVEQTIRGIREEFQSADRTLESRFNRTLSGAETRIKDSANSYTDTELASMRETLIESVDGEVSKVTQSLDRYESRLENAEGNISTNTQLINGFNRQVEEVGERLTRVSETIDGVRTTVRDEAYSYTDTELAKLRRTEIKNIQGSVSTMEQSIENFRQTLRTASGDFSQVEQTLQGIREEFEAGDREVKASFERTLNGMETQIKKDNKSYTDTAIADLKQTEIQSLDGRVTTATQTVNGFSRRIRDAEGAISSVRQSVQGFDQRIQGVEGSYSQLSQTVGGLTTAVNGHNGLQSRVTQLADQLSSKVSSDDFSTHLSQYSDTIWAAVRSRVPSSSGKMTGSEIISAIRLDRSGVKISGSKVQITGDTSIDNAVIKNSHIASLNADKITAGTLNAARVRVINLDANNITGNKTNFVQSNWNNINDRVQITSAGIEMINSGAWRKTIYTATGLEMFRGRGAGDNAGVIGYFKGSDYHANDEEYFMDGFGDHHTIGIGAYGQIALGTGNDTSIRKFEPKMVINQKYDGIQTNKIAALKTEAGFTISAGTARGEWASIIGGSLNGRNRLTFAQSIATLEANDKLDFYASAGARVMRLTYKSVDINGSIKYSSDARLKTNIKRSKQNSLSQILNIEYTNFDWKDGSKHQFGFIAQQVQQSASELITTDSEDYLRYDETRYVHTIGHALQQSHEQLLERLENLEEENKKLKEKLNEAV